MAQIISVVNQKGGVGKTTTAVNLGAYLARAGKFVLLVDLDPQANATSGVGLDHREMERGIYEVLAGSCSLREIIRNTTVEGFRIAPSTPNLAGAGVELVGAENREYRLHEALMEVKHEYDYVIIDSAPSLGLLTINGLVAADKVLIPVQAEYYALEGLGQLMDTVKLVRDNVKPELDVAGAVITMFDGRNKLSNEVMSELHKYFPDKIFNTLIPRNVRLAEAPSFGQPIMVYDERSKGARAYEQLAQEFIEVFERAEKEADAHAL
jgi:chromosome partitioning protein